MLSLDEARELIASMVIPVAETEELALAEALGRALAEDVIAEVNVPPHDNSAMDGYALRSSDAGARRVIGIAHAGRPFSGAVGEGECVRVLTGALVPAGCDAVVMQERAAREGDRVTALDPITPRQNIRDAGEDLRRGSVVLGAGRALRPADLGAIASLGRARVKVKRRPRVGHFTTGDELRPAGAALAPGELYDSNRALLHALIARAGALPVDLGHARDDEGELRARATADPTCDLVISTGGVAVGDADLVARAIGARPIEVAMKPGRHLAVATLARGAFVGLPGNPVAVAATFDAIVEGVIHLVAGVAPRARLLLRARLESRIKNPHPRVDFHRGKLSRAADGTLAVRSTGHQGAGILRSLLEADCFIVVPPSAGELALGAWVDVEPFGERL